MIGGNERIQGLPVAAARMGRTLGSDPGLPGLHFWDETTAVAAIMRPVRQPDFCTLSIFKPEPVIQGQTQGADPIRDGR